MDRARLLALLASVRAGDVGVDAAAEAADLPPEVRYAILAEDDVLTRVVFLLDALDRKARGGDESLPPRTDPRLN